VVIVLGASYIMGGHGAADTLGQTRF